jgi:hypothetical protein
MSGIVQFSRVICPGLVWQLAFLGTVLWTSVGRADLRFLEPVANASEVRSGMALRHTFKFVNDGPETVEITGTQGSCGCLSPTIAKRSLKPGEEGELVVDVNTLSPAAGPHEWRIKLAYKAGDHLHEMTLRLNAKIIREVTVEPTAVTMFAESGLGTEIAVSDIRPNPLSVKEVRTSSASLKARISEPAKDQQGHSMHKITLTVAADLQEGRYDESIDIVTNDAGYASIKVPVTVVKRSQQRYSATPRDVTLQATSMQPIPSRIVLLRDSSNQQVVVEKIAADHPAITCRWAQGPGTNATLKVGVDHTKVTEKSLSSALHIHFSGPVKEALTIPVKLTIE